ncbi:MAG TPA: hypothetical protein VIW23_18345 [Candidatus Acidoferrum sp.]|jgi:hypothetical protein
MSERHLVSAVDRLGTEVQGRQDRPSSPQETAAVHSTLAQKMLEALKWMFSFPAMLGSVLVGTLVSQLRGFHVDPDVWWHIKNGQNIAASHHWPTVDPYSFTVSGTPWLAYEWLGDVMLGFVARFGLRALDGLLMALAGAIAIAVYYYASLCARHSKAGFVSAFLVSIFAIANFNLRPQMFGALFLAITLILLELFRQGRPKALWVLPPLFLIWINTHGSWIIGFGVVLVTLLGGLVEFRIGGIKGERWTEKQRIQLEVALLGSILVVPLTPYGTELATYPFLVASSLPLNVAYVIEWAPMPFNLYWGKLFLALLAGAFLLQMMYQFTFSLQRWILAIGGIVMACLHVRFVLLFAPFFAPILAIMLARWIDGYQRDKDKHFLNAVVMAAVVVATLWYFPSRSELEREVEKQFPVRAVNSLHSHPMPGPMFNTYGYGGYLIANLPEQKVFIDGRGDLYELGGAFADFVQVEKLKPAAFSVLRSYGIRMCLLERSEPLAVVLAEQQDWKRVYSDDQSVIFVRQDSPSVAGSNSGMFSNSARSGHEPAD